MAEVEGDPDAASWFKWKAWGYPFPFGSEMEMPIPTHEAFRLLELAFRITGTEE